MKNYRLETARTEDLPLLGEIEKNAARIFPAGSLPEEMLDDSVPLPLLTEAQAKGNLWVARPLCPACPPLLNGRPIGYALLRFVDGLALLAQIDILPEHGRRGLGTALIQLAAQRAKECGHAHLFLTTFAQVPWNAPFYARLGFREIGPREQPETISRILADETAAGLKNRLAMRLDL